MFPGIDKQERWIPDNPSAFHLRTSIMDYGVLALGSETIRTSMQDDEHVRSILFHGPMGSGKTLMAQAIASETGALFINLSPSTIDNAFRGKEGATKLVHMAFTVAKVKQYAPVVIYIDNCHEFFMGKSKKGASSDVNTDMQRFQKDLLIYKNQALKKEDRVLVIGCTNVPEKGDAKLLRWRGPTGKPEKQGFFERSLYFPNAHHADRVVLWREFIQRRLVEVSKHAKFPQVDCNALALLSSGLSAGEICSIVEAVLTLDRIKRSSAEPLSEDDFSRYFARRASDEERFLTFNRQITDLDSRWKSIHMPKKENTKEKM
eukprot:g13348.t1 g13348   contig8:459114-460067(+)